MRQEAPRADTYAEAAAAYSDVRPEDPPSGQTLAHLPADDANPGIPLRVPFPEKYRDPHRLCKTHLSTTWVVFNEDTQSRVVIKQPAVRILLDRESAQQFRQEIQISARLIHPGIVPIRETKLDEPPWFYTMPFIEGLHLDQHCRVNSLDLTARLKLFAEVCEAVAFAHERGVIHRDLKPNNIIVTPEGQAVVLDFGLGRFVNAQAPQQDQEVDGVMGAPAYMAPEQTEGLAGSTRTDVHALGVILYELLTGRLPTTPDIADLGETFRRIREEEPPPVSDIDKSVPWELEAVVRRALAKEPAERQRDAAELAEDIRCFLTGLAIPTVEQSLSAPAARGVYRLEKWVKRNRRGVAAGLVVLMGIVALTAYMVNSEVRQREALRHEVLLRGVGVGRWYVDRDDPVNAARYLWSAHLEEPSLRTRYALLEFFQHYPCLCSIDCGAVRDVEYSPDGRWLLAASQAGELLVIDRALRSACQQISTDTAHAKCLCVTKNGCQVVVGGDDGWVRMWDFDPEAGRLGESARSAWRVSDGEINAVALSDDESLLALATGTLVEPTPGDKTWIGCGLHVYRCDDHGEWTDWRHYPLEENLGLSAAFSPDDHTLAFGCSKCPGSRAAYCIFVDTDSGQIVGRDAVDSHCRGLAYTPDGTSMVLGGGQLHLSNSQGDAQVHLTDNVRWGVRSVDVALRNGDLLAACGVGDGRVRFYDLASRKCLPFQGYHDSQAIQVDVCFSPDALEVASAGPGGIRIWRPLNRITCYDPSGECSGEATIAVGTDGTTYAACTPSPQGEYELWMGTADGASLLSPLNRRCREIAFEGNLLAMAVDDPEGAGRIVVQDLATPANSLVSTPIPGLDVMGTWLGWYREDPALLLLRQDDGHLRLWRCQDDPDGRHHELIHAFPPDRGVTADAAQTADRKWLVLVAEGSSVPGKAAVFESTGVALADAPFADAYRLFNTFDIPGYTWTTALQRSPAGALWLAVSGGGDAEITVFDVASGREQFHFGGQRDVVPQIEHLTDRLVVTSSRDGTVRIWDLWNREELCTLRANTGRSIPIAVAAGRVFLYEEGYVTIIDTNDLDQFIAGNIDSARRNLIDPVPEFVSP
jgi:WD40 repeat protein